ncbi:MAG: hypothetical protein AAF408_07225 [Pseudomonadota bacterium]
MVQITLSRLIAASIGGAALWLSACAEPEVILPGNREDIRPTDDSAVTAEKPVSISLPSQKTNASWPQGFGTAAFRTDHPALRPTPQRIWSVPIGAGDSRRQRITADPVVAGGLVYTLDAAARVTAVTTAGAPVWSVDLIPPGEGDEQATGGGLALSDGVLYNIDGWREIILSSIIDSLRKMIIFSTPTSTF